MTKRCHCDQYKQEQWPDSASPVVNIIPSCVNTRLQIA